MVPRWLVLLVLAGSPPAAGPGVGDDLPLSGRIEFDIEKDTLRPASLPILDDVVVYLGDHPEVALVEIRAHLAHDPDREAYGRKLSQQRADAVADYLIHQGVDRDRLMPVGYEASVPLVSYDTKGASVTNRRVELRVLELTTPPP